MKFISILLIVLCFVFCTSCSFIKTTDQEEEIQNKISLSSSEKIIPTQKQGPLMPPIISKKTIEKYPLSKSKPSKPPLPPIRQISPIPPKNITKQNTKTNINKFEKSPNYTSSQKPLSKNNISEKTMILLYFVNHKTSKNCLSVEPISREIIYTDSLDRIVLQTLFNGPTIEEMQEGAFSIFSPATADLLQTVKFNNNTVFIDLKDFRNKEKMYYLPQIEIKCVRDSFVTQITKTLQQFPSVKKVEFTINGSTAEFNKYMK